MSRLPEGWEQITLSDVFEIGSSKRVHKHEWQTEGIPFYRAREIKRLALYGEVDNDLFVTPALYSNYEQEHGVPAANDLMVTAVGTLGVCYRVKEGDKFYFKDASVLWFRSAADFDTEFFKKQFLSDVILDQVHQGGGTTVGTYTISSAKKTIAMLPPLAEQRRIVVKLDQLSARTRAAKDHLARVQTLATRAKQTTLAAAFRGELTSMGDRSVKAPSDEFWSVPEGWDWKTVADIGAVALGRQRSPKNHNGPQMRPYIRAANITWGGIDLSDVKEMNFDDADFARFALKPGDVLLNEGSGSPKEVGKPAIWRGEIAGACFQNTVLRVQPTECSPEYLYWYFYRTALHAGFVDSTQGVNIQHIGKKGLAEFPIPVPSSEEQSEIVRRIEAAFARIDRMVADAARAAALLERLEAQLLAKAFRGELVPQDPNDEPASALLTRIREARANTPKLKRKRRS